MSRPDRCRHCQLVRRERTKAALALGPERQKKGLRAHPRPILPNRQSEFRTLEEERVERQLTVQGQFEPSCPASSSG